MNEDIDLVVNLPGLIKIFGDALYQDFGSVVRELVQKSHDAILENAIVRKRAGQKKGRSASEARTRIDVHLDEGELVLVVADNGVGMDEDGLRTKLNNFASSAKRSLGQAFEALIGEDDNDDDLESANVIGEYGVGFLSVMAVSNSVSVCTRKADNVPVRWVYETEQAKAKIKSISIEEFNAAYKERRLTPPATGTIVIAELSEDAASTYGIDEAEVQASLTRYTSLLPIPVYFNSERVSGKYRAWNNPRTATEADWRQMIEETYDQSPSYIIPVSSPPQELDVTGVLWIPERINISMKHQSMFM
jgi:HSP90 family molecular chaperone